MSVLQSPRVRLAAGAAVVALALGAAFTLGRTTAKPPAPMAQAGARKPLYWYDPMVPAQHFEKPGKSPFMDMQLVPKYADERPGEAGVRIDPTATQNLGVRLATAQRGELPGGLTTTGAVEFNERDVAVVQARAAGFVQRVYGRAPGDVIAAGAPLADVLIPEWGGAQGEYLAVRRTGDPALVEAARQRLVLLGMSPGLIDRVDRTGKAQTVVTITTPAGGVIKTLGVRNGMAITAGQTLAEVNGLSRVWINAAAPEALAGQVRPGETATATLAAYPGETFTGRVTAILPQAEVASRTLTVRIELANPGGRLRPGMFATVVFAGASRPALLVPSEAVIRTGKRTLVMLAKDGGRYLPAEITAGREARGRTEVLSGLAEGEKVVASGQFLLDSEASLSGVQARPAANPAPMKMAPALYETTGRIEQLTADSVTLSHEPVPALKWPAMTMQFGLAKGVAPAGLKTGDRVRFTFDQAPTGPMVHRMTREAVR
jgi:Cu(I)/Ag(I) efflux system membrane fusion protein